MINAIIVDDEPLALDVLETYLENVADVNLASRCTNAFDANKALHDNHIDLMFLDIEMPQLTGIDFLKTLKYSPLVIFTTAYPNYALEGFELDAVDYLLKPISLDRFIKAVNKAIDAIHVRNKSQASAFDRVDDDFIFVKADKKLVKIHYNEILYIEGLKDYVIIRTDKGRVITLQTMKSLEEKLPSSIFRRIHRSYIGNMNKIEAIVGNMVEVKEKGQTKHIPIGKNYRDDLLSLVNQKRL